VEKVLLDDNNRATGLVYVDNDGKSHQVNVKNEVILAAGALETVPLLNRSGIGSQKALEMLAPHGVEPKVILEGLGKGQGDRREVGVVYELNEPLALLDKLDPNDRASQVWETWAKGQGGPLASNGPFFSCQVKSRPDLAEPDLFIFAVPGDFQGYWLGNDNNVKLAPGETSKNYAEHALHDKTKITFLVLHANKNVNNGTIEVNPLDPLGPPIVDHHFELDPNNDALVAGVRTVRQLVKESFAHLIKKEVWPGSDAQHDAAISKLIGDQKWGHHPRGGAQSGHPNDPDTVVDTNFKVLGTTGLRVIDASAMPDQIGTFIVSGVYQQAKLAALKIAEEAGDGPKPAAKFNPLSIRMAPEPENLKQAQATTKKSAADAKNAGMISDRQFKRLTDGTVSKMDVDVAWQAIVDVLGSDKKEIIGGDRHTLAHNLLLSVTRQIQKQDPRKTKSETRRDAVAVKVDQLTGRDGVKS
jgi:choline dehydrogenase